MTGEMCPSGRGTCRKCREGERGKPERGGDGNDCGCGRAELRLDQIGRADWSVDARSPDGGAAKPSGRETARPSSPASVARAASEWRGRHGTARTEHSRADPTQPSPIQPNPTQPVKCKTGGSAKARIRSPGAFRQEDRSGWRQCRWHVGCRDCGPGAALIYPALGGV